PRAGRRADRGLANVGGALPTMSCWALAGRDDELRRRLRRRFGGAIEPWLGALPRVLSELAERRRLAFESLVQRGSMSVVIRCRTTDGRPAVLKISPDRERLATEARALAGWHTRHVPAVLAVDASVGALLIEAVEPGTALDESGVFPPMQSVGALVGALHATGASDGTYGPVAARVAYLFDSGNKHYE